MSEIINNKFETFFKLYWSCKKQDENREKEILEKGQELILLIRSSEEDFTSLSLVTNSIVNQLESKAPEDLNPYLSMTSSGFFCEARR